jgi:hypothetical protein
VRDCGYNVGAEAEGKKLLIDYQVFINGEHRATLVKYATDSRKYNLYDIRLRPIWVGRDKLHHSPYLGSTVETKKEFEDFIKAALVEGSIPTLLETVERDLAEKNEKKRLEAEKAEKERQEKIRDAAPDLLAALQVSLDMLNQLLTAAEKNIVPDVSIGFFKNRTEIIEPAIAKATGGSQ